MRIAKSIFSLVFVLLLINGRAHHFASNGTNKKPLKGKIVLVNGAKSLGQDKDSQDGSRKRKPRPRGIEAPVPQIPDLSFEQVFTYAATTFPKVNTFYFSIQYCQHGKRGPPVL